MGRHFIRLSFSIKPELKVWVLCILFFTPFLLNRGTLAESPKSFYPTWKLLKGSERKNFLSGYLHGWQDSKRVTEILLEHTKEHPDSAVKNLEKIREIYGVSDFPLELLLERVNAFYEEPENRDAPLSVAISSGNG